MLSKTSSSLSDFGTVGLLGSTGLPTSVDRSAKKSTVAATLPNRPSFLSRIESRFQSSTPMALALSVDWLAFQPPGTNHCRQITLIPLGPSAESDPLTFSTRHISKISAARFGVMLGHGPNTARTVLYTASNDALYQWNLTRRGWAADESPTSRLLIEDLGNVAHISTQANGKLIAVCVDDVVFVVDVISGRPICLEGHTARVNMSEFLLETSRPSTSYDRLVSLSEDRTFKIWDIEGRCCVYQSCILTAAPLTSIAIDPIQSRFVVGAEDGRLRFYDLTSRRGHLCEPRMLTLLDVEAMVPDLLAPDPRNVAEADKPMEFISSMPAWRSKNSPLSPLPAPANDTIHHSPSILGLHYMVTSDLWDLDDVEDDPDSEKDIKRIYQRAYLLVGLTSGVLVIDPATYTILHILDLTKSADMMGIADLASCFAFSTDTVYPRSLSFLSGNNLTGNFNLFVVQNQDTGHRKREEIIPGTQVSLHSLVQARVDEHVKGRWSQNVYRDCLSELAQLGIRSVDDIQHLGDIQFGSKVPAYVQDALYDLARAADGLPEPTTHFENLSFTQSPDATYHSSSPLKPKNIISSAASATGRTVSKNGSRLGSRIQDKPVTFHSKVKSSGYTAKPAMTTLFGRKSLPKNSTGKTLRKVPYPQSTAPLRLEELLAMVHHTKPINCVKFNSSGMFCITTSNDCTARFHRVPIKPNTKPKELIGHDGPVTGAWWSASDKSVFGQIILTTSLDGSARLWSTKQSEPLLECREALGCRKVAMKTASFTSAASPTPQRKLSSSEVRQARFYYRDQFLVIPTGQHCNIYRYHLEKPEEGSVRPGLNYNSYSLAKRLTISANTVSAIACPNFRTSHIILSATSDKDIHVWDVAQCKIIRTILRAHTRTPHTIALADYADTPSSFQNVFVTAAVTDSLKCWDLRQERPIWHLHGHVNRYANIGCALSPCGRYIATGSEDNHAYVYDVRNGSVLDRLGGHTDVVSSVDFCSSRPLLLTSSFDGKLRAYVP